MAERNDEVLERVRQELGRQSDLGSRQLFEMAQEMDSSMAKMSLPQFHARYVLPIKREQAAQRSSDEQASRKPRKTAKGGKRAAAARQEEAAAQEEPAGEQQPAGQRQRSRTERKKASAGAGAQTSQGAGAEQPAQQTQTAQPSQKADRDRVRSVFLEFALEVAQADGRVEMARILSKVDEYVDRVA